MKPISELFPALFPATVGAVKGQGSAGVKSEPPREGDCALPSNAKLREITKRFIAGVKLYGLSVQVHKPSIYDTPRIVLSGDNADKLRGAQHYLIDNPAVEAVLIINAVKRYDSSYMEQIEERASIRWTEGYSDSLFFAVLCNIAPMKETKEYHDKPDKEYAEFLRSIGFTETQIAQIRPAKMKPRTDWEREKRELDFPKFTSSIRYV